MFISTSTPISRLTLSDGNSVPWLAYGTGSAHRSSDVHAPVTLALSSGFTHIDGAQLYRNEESFGSALSASSIPRSELFITTKLGKLDPESPGGVEGTLRETLRKLRVGWVDLFLIHSPLLHQQYEGRIGDVWREMVEVKKRGLAKSIGVSNFSVKHLKEIEKTGLEMPVVNQVRTISYLCFTG